MSELEREDVVSEVLVAGRVRGTVWCLSDVAPPWSVGVAQREPAGRVALSRSSALST